MKEGFLNFLRSLMSVAFSLMKNVLLPLAKSVLIPLRLIASASETDAAVQKENFQSVTTAPIILNKEMKDIMKIFKPINLDGYKSIGSYWVALYVNGDNITYFDIF